MMRYLVSICLLLALHLSMAQVITGNVLDSEGEPLFSATVMLLNAEDSVLASYAMSDEEGKFELKRVKDGSYLLRVNFVGFVPYDTPVQVQGNDIALGEIALEVQLLDEVVVEGEAIPITMKKDTIEYNAAAFATRENAVVEDLLKKLPGVEVDRDGTVRSQGEAVEKVLVDGKEFFGEDPQMATKNLPADAISKVQVFDQQSEFAQFSGIDDGNDMKTINLTLKEDHKKGTFGNVGGGAGTDGRHMLSATVNQFREDNQFSFIGKHNNINEQGFSLSEYISFMGGLGNMGGGSGRIQVRGNTSLPLSNGLSDGFVTSTSSGLNYNRDFDKTDVRASYVFSRIKNTSDRTTDRTNFVNDQNFETNERSNSVSTGNTHNLNLNVKHEIDKSQDIQIRNRFNLQDGDVVNSTSTANSSEIGNSNALSNYESSGLNFGINSSLMYRKKFSKIGRTLVTELSVSAQQSDTDYLLSTSITGGDDVDQEQVTDTRSTALGLEIAYTEPIGKSKYLELRYERNVSVGDSDKDFFDLAGNDRTLNTDLSSFFERRFTYNRTGLSFNYAKKDFRLTAGANYQFSTLDGDLPDQSETFSSDFNRTLPFMRMNYDVSSSVSFSLDYNTRLSIPTVTQLQPVTDNSNPLNIYSGNPDLKAEYAHTGMLHFRFFDQFSNTSLFSMLSVTYTLDNIVTSREVDDVTFAQVSQPVNADDAFMVSSYTAFSRPIKFAKTRFRLSNRLSMMEGFAIINDVTSQTTNTNNTVSMSFENIKKKSIDWTVGTNYTTGKTQGSQESTNQDFTNQTYYADLTVFLPGKWSVTNNYDYQIYQGASFAQDNEVQLWQASVQKSFLKDDRGELKLSVFDILGQNQGVDRTTDLNFIEESRVASLGTYYMVSFTYRLSAFAPKGLQFDSMRRRT